MISDIDLKDWVPTDQSIELHKVDRNTVITIPNVDVTLFFHHIDGMYSLLTILDGEHKGEITHIAAWTEVIPWVKKDQIS